MSPNSVVTGYVSGVYLYVTKLKGFTAFCKPRLTTSPDPDLVFPDLTGRPTHLPPAQDM